MQNALNSSMTSKVGNATARSGASGTRADSKSRNGDLQSQNLKKVANTT